MRKKRANRMMRKPSSQCVISGKSYFALTIANGNTSVVQAIDPMTLGGAPNALASGFKFYRLRNLRFNFDPVVRFETSVPATTSCGRWSAGYVPESITGSTAINDLYLRTLPDATSGIAQVVNVSTPPGVLLCAGDTISRWIDVKRQTLNMGLERMWLCQGSAGPGVTQGYLAVAVADAAGANTVTFSVLVDWTIEFLEPELSGTLGIAAPRTLELEVKSEEISVYEKDPGAPMNGTPRVWTPETGVRGAPENPKQKYVLVPGIPLSRK
jgi:hypothetical protein